MFLDRTEDDDKNTNWDSKEEKATRPYLCPRIVLSPFESVLTEAVGRVHQSVCYSRSFSEKSLKEIRSHCSASSGKTYVPFRLGTVCPGVFQS